jgi:hypothetical protein
MEQKLAEIARDKDDMLTLVDFIIYNNSLIYRFYWILII